MAPHRLAFAILSALALPIAQAETPAADPLPRASPGETEAPVTEQTTASLSLPTMRGLDRANFDPEARACDNFYLHVNGNWLRNNPIPADQAQWNSFGILAEQNNLHLKAILERAADGKAEAGSVEQQVGDFYRSFLDEQKIEELGLAPLAAELAAIEAISTPSEVAAAVIRRHAEALGGLFAFFVMADLKDSQVNLAYATQGGLGLPNKTYYEPTDEAGRTILENYRKHVARFFELAGSDAGAAEEMAAAVLRLETRLAAASQSPVELRDPTRRYNPVTVAEAAALTPNFPWSDYFAALGVAPERFSLSPVAFFQAVDTAIAEVPAADWQAYLRWHTLRAAAPLLPKAFVDADFDFFQRQLAGAQVMQSRDQRAVEMVNQLLGEPLGQLYVREHFPPAAKEQMAILIGDLKTALKGRLEKLEWMSEETRAQALEKFASFSPKIGYPDKWRDYSEVVIAADALVANARALRQHLQREMLDKVGKPVDREEWRMAPQIVNAYYNPTVNEIVFPAGILQPPFFDPEADPALNYGAIGAVIGHELLHGFDDSGSRFDAVGNLRNWWTEEDRKRFEERTGKLVRQYDGYQTAGLNVSGALSLGENIADLGGLTVAYDALQARLARDPQPEEIDGLTQEQRFFAAWAQVWRTNARPERLRLQVRNGPHAPGKFRGMAPMKNLASFAKAWDCKPGDPMVAAPEDRVVIW